MNRKRLIPVILILTTAIIFLIVLLMSRGDSYGTLELRAIDDTPDNSDITAQIISHENQEEQTVTLRPGETKTLQIKTGTVQINGSAGNLKAVDVVKIEKSTTVHLTTPTSENRALKQIGSNARICPVVIGESVYSYNCQGNGIVSRNAPGDSMALFGGQSFSSLQPVKDSLVGFYANNTSELIYLDLANENVHAISLPDNVQDLLARENIPQIVTSEDPASSRFALVLNESGAVYLFSDLSGDNPVEIKPGSDVKLGENQRSSSSSFSGDRFILYAGNFSDVYDGLPTFSSPEDTPQLPSYVFEYDFSGELVNTIKLPRGFSALGIYKLASNYYVSDHPDEFNFYYLRDGRLERVYNLFGVADWIVFQNNAYIQEGGTLYRFTPAENGLFGLHGLFSSPDLRVSRIFASSKGILLTAFAGDSANAQLNIYQLLDEAASPGVRPPGTVPSNISYENLDLLLNYGITTTQVQELKKAFGRYLESANSNANRVSIDAIQVVPRDRSSPSRQNTINFRAMIGQDNLRAKIEYSNLTDIRLFLYDESSDRQVYDSGT